LDRLVVGTPWKGALMAEEPVYSTDILGRKVLVLPDYRISRSQSFYMLPKKLRDEIEADEAEFATDMQIKYGDMWAWDAEMRRHLEAKKA
jgi:hypothetical protein